MRKFTGKMPNASNTTSIEHRALTLTVRTPQCGHTVWGKNGFSIQNCEGEIARLQLISYSLVVMAVENPKKMEIYGWEQEHH